MSETLEQAGTVLPRWTRVDQPTPPGTGEQRTAVPAELVAGVRKLAAECGVPVESVLLAAHLKVLSALSSERSVGTGLAGRLCRATLPDGSWRELITEAHRAAAAAEGSQGAATPTTETAIEISVGDAAAPTPDAGRPLDPQVVLHTAYTLTPDGMTLCLTRRREAFAADFTERVSGYHLAALRSMCAGPDAPHDTQSLVSDEELDVLMHDLSGPREPLPDALFVELFEGQVRRHPDDLAALHNERSWTYRELDTRANQIAHALLSRGLHAEDVVAVVMERNLDWLAATLGVFKAGGVYLPVRPDFPADRIGSQLDRRRCRFAVTEPGGDRTLAEAVERAGLECSPIHVADAYRESDGAASPPVPIGPDQLAYIYFTSGSTGTPKGAMCEHAGMLNHLYMKIEDLELGPGVTVTQTASQCFDISLWQLIAPLLVGGRTEIVDTDVQLDVRRFLDHVTGGAVDVIQIVPSYLDIMLTHLERHPQPLGTLRTVSVTGEALKRGLIERWFALYPSVALVNAYGATEVSDDTMHAVLHGVPDRNLPIVPVGRSLRNVNTYILDERLRIVPLGAPGEIAFSGVCVGRGYINDPERTAQAFVDDPHRPGERLYRTGDFGRWVPEGTIEFLGRRDEQVKIRGFRIEIGEIESRLLRMPGVAEAAVVIDGRSDQTRNLVAFYTGPEPLEPADLRDFLAGSLPDYMVPSYFHQLDALPLNENGKVAKKTLIALAAELGRDSAAYEPPCTETERRLATAWAEILGVLVGRISRGDDFFRLGGTSLAAVRLVVQLDRLVSLRQLVAHPVLSDLAALIDTLSDPAADGASKAGSDAAAAKKKAETGSASGVLQRLSAAGTTPQRATLICFPYAGGNAVNFQSLAKELETAGVAVFGVELPAHDVARADEDLADVAEVARRAHREIEESVTGPVLIWGHCAGAAHALELARLLESGGRVPERVLIGALLLDDPDTLAQETKAVSALSNREVTAQLHQDSAYIELDLLKAERAELVGEAFRHDVRTTNDHLIAVQDGTQRWRLRAALDIVVAVDDPTTTGFEERYRRWEELADTVELHTLREGGHYFIRTRPDAVAAIVAAAVAGSASGSSGAGADAAGGPA